MKIAIAFFAGLMLATAANAETLAFDFKDPTGANNVAFKLDAAQEPINGTASGISGMVTTNPSNLTEMKGKILIDANTLLLPNPTMQQQLQGEGWLDIKKNAEISFEVKRVSDLKKDGGSSTADVTGIFTLKGISKEITIPVKITYLPEKFRSNCTEGAGDLLTIRTNFQIKRSDYDINPGEKPENAADKVDLSLSIVGSSSKTPATAKAD